MASVLATDPASMTALRCVHPAQARLEHVLPGKCRFHAPMIGALGLKILLIEDEAATARTLALRQLVDRSQQRFGNVCRISAKLLPPLSQPASPPLTAVPKRQARGGKYG